MSNLNIIISYVFRLFFISFIIINYIYFVTVLWYPVCKVHISALIIVFFFNFLVIMLLWSIFMTAYTEPGKVPLYWGFYIGDTDEKRKRYCLMCNVFKPERCHHCSICNKCILNMDHHCPWLNNCIGFYNRKFFIQMLFYLTLILIYSDCVNFDQFITILIRIYRNRINLSKELTDSFVFLLYYLIDFTLTIIISMFFRFHLKLILQNKTTIETLEKKVPFFISQFDIGTHKNWSQVMGTNKLLWFFPIKLSLGMPIGNGIDWFNKDESKRIDISISTNYIADHNLKKPSIIIDNSTLNANQPNSTADIKIISSRENVPQSYRENDPSFEDSKKQSVINMNKDSININAPKLIN